MRKIDNIHFFDGETINNKYFLLANENNYIIDIKGLSLKKCLDFLFKEGKQNNYFFRIEYDINMMFSKEKYDEKLKAFFNSEQTEFYNYKVTYFKNKILIIQKGNTLKKFFDVSNFFQKSFLKTLDILKIKMNAEDLKFLEKYKSLRASFNKKDLQNIIKYCLIENKYGLEIVKKIYELIPEEYKTLSLYGSSSLTNKFLSVHKIDSTFNFFGVYNNENFEAAYFGGRMEALKIGTFNKCYKYDINSAYPSMIKDLKEIIDYKTRKYKNTEIIETNLYYINVFINDNDIIGLLPQRLKSGYLIFPQDVTGWYYGFEVQQVVNYSKKYDVYYKITKEINIKLGSKVFNENQIENIYKLRQEYKKAGDLKQYIFKILLNGIYGKLCQRVGKAKFQNFYYAGLITSFCRAQLLKAVIENPYDVIFFATDGILTLKKIKGLKENADLGNWDYVEIKKAIVLLSGVYKLIDKENKIYLGERGFNFNFDEVFKEILKNETAKITSNIFIGNKYYDKNKKAFNGYRCKFKQIEKIINPKNQIKRIYDLTSLNLRKNYTSLLLTTEFINKLNETISENIFDMENEEL